MKIQDVKQVINKYLQDNYLVDTTTTNFENELLKNIGIDSLDFIELIMDIEKELNIWLKDELIEELKTIQNLYDLVYNTVNK